MNNVGIGIHRGGGLLQLTRSAAESVLRTNMIEPLFLTQHIVREMITHHIRGVVLFTSSIHSHVPYVDPIYAMTKAAIEMLVRNLAVELAEYGIRVNAVAPGAIATRNHTLSHPLVPLKQQRGTPADIAQAMVFLAAEETSGYITGQTLIVDGGFSLAHAEYWKQKGSFKRVRQIAVQPFHILMSGTSTDRGRRLKMEKIRPIAVRIKVAETFSCRDSQITL